MDETWDHLLGGSSSGPLITIRRLTGWTTQYSVQIDFKVMEYIRAGDVIDRVQVLVDCRQAFDMP